MYRPSLLLLSMALVLTVHLGCGRSSESAEPVSKPPDLPPGNALPPDIDSMLFGSAQACASDDDCPSHVCYYSSCVGLLLADQRWMQITMAEALVAAVADNEALRDRVVQHLDRLLGRAETDLAYRGRALAALETLHAHGSLKGLLEDGAEVLRDGAALALTRLGAADGIERTVALARAEQPAVAMEALRALGHAEGSGDAPLVALLETLNPALDAALLGAAIDGLQRLKDPRAIGPLVAFMEEAPTFLHLRVARCLHDLAAGAHKGGAVEGWIAWAKTQSLKPAPEVSIRVYSAAETLGFPAP